MPCCAVAVPILSAFALLDHWHCASKLRDWCAEPERRTRTKLQLMSRLEISRLLMNAIREQWTSHQPLQITLLRYASKTS